MGFASFWGGMSWPRRQRKIEKAYAVSLLIVRADGDGVSGLVGRQLRGTLVVSGLACDFEDPHGKTFAVSGDLEDIPADIAAKSGVQRVSFKDVEYRFRSHLSMGEWSCLHAKVMFSTGVTQDWFGLVGITIRAVKLSGESSVRFVELRGDAYIKERP